MLDMPEFYDHVEEEIEAEMRYLNKLWKAKLEQDRKDKVETEADKDTE